MNPFKKAAERLAKTLDSAQPLFDQLKANAAEDVVTLTGLAETALDKVKKDLKDFATETPAAEAPKPAAAKPAPKKAAVKKTDLGVTECGVPAEPTSAAPVAKPKPAAKKKPAFKKPKI